MKSAEQEYINNNTDNTAEMAYAVNNNQMSVSDLPKDFDSSLLNSEAKERFDGLGKTEKAEMGESSDKPNSKKKSS